MTNSIRLFVVASQLANGEAQVTSCETLPSGCGSAANGSATVSPVVLNQVGSGGDEGWLEMEWSEGLM